MCFALIEGKKGILELSFKNATFNVFDAVLLWLIEVKTDYSHPDLG